MDINSFVIGFAKGKKSGTGFFSTKENDAGGLTYAFKATEGGGGGSGGGVELNIAYGDTAPEDTTKLWVKTTQPSGVVVSAVEGGSVRQEGIEDYGTIPDIRRAAWATVGTKMYRFGGGAFNNSTNAITSIYCFDTETQEFAKVTATLPESRVDMGCVSIGTKVYLFGGLTKQNSGETVATIFVFDTESETISTLSATVGFGLFGMGCAKSFDESTVYLIGGYDTDGTGRYVKQIREFDVETETLSTVSSLPYAMGYPICERIGADIYIFGGDNAYKKQDVFVYHAATAQIPYTYSDILPHAVVQAGHAKVGNAIYIFGGGDSDLGSGSYTDILLFDPEKSNPVKTLNTALPKTANIWSAAHINEYIYVVPGAYRFAYKIGDTTLENGKLQITPHATDNIFPIINTDTARVEIGVNKVYKGNADNEADVVTAALYKDGAWTNI
jgi:hypothetical protein